MTRKKLFLIILFLIILLAALFWYVREKNLQSLKNNESTQEENTYNADIRITSYNVCYTKLLRNFDQLVHDFILTIILVFGILFLIIGLKEALVASLAIPLVFFITFGVMLYFGISLNFLSMISLILALGLLVDDAIVVVSATKQYLNTGKFTPEEAVLLVLNDFKVVLLTTTLTTVWAFLPLLFAVITSYSIHYTKLYE